MQLNLKEQLSRNEINFRKYLKQYHPDKYRELLSKEKEFKSTTKEGKFINDYFFFIGCGNNHKTAIHNARICQEYY